MFKIGLSVIKKDLMTASFFEECADAGIDCVEISPEVENHAVLDVARIADTARKCGVEVWSYHLPFLPFEEFDISKAELARASVDLASEYIKRGGDAGIKNYVIHSSGEPINNSERKVRMETAKKSLFELAEVARQAGGQVLVENLPRTVLGKNSDEVIELISAHPDLKVVFDTNHLLSQDPIEFIKKVGKSIVSTHVSDYDKIDEKHWLPGEGSADFYAIASALEEIGYTGPWLYEVLLYNTERRVRSRNINVYDIVRNAKEIFTSRPLTVIN